MFSARCLALMTALSSLIISTSAYAADAKTNVAIYYGQGPNEVNLGLEEFCKNSNVDIIPLGFLDIYPAQGNGFPGTNFASSCGPTNFIGPGYNNVDDASKNDLKNSCSSLVDGIGPCQTGGKKILLSLGGAPGSTHYQLTSTDDADYMADFLWGAFGPLQSQNTWPRPFDDATTGSHSVDGFDFDIEVIQPGEQQLYIRMITRLMGYFPTGPGAKKYLITGAPQCIVPDNQMGDMITAVPFDILFMQYYNTDACSARNWVNANPDYPSVPAEASGFDYEFDQLLAFLKGGASKNAKIYFGLPGAEAAANSGEYLDVTEVTHLLDAYFCQPSFGGVMVWEGIYAYNNLYNGKNFQNNMKDLLTADSINATLKTCPTNTPTYTSSTATPTPTACCTNPYTIVSGDTCSAIATSNNLSLAQLYALNPSLNNGLNCPFLQIGQVLCLARASSTTAVCSITSATTTTSASATPTACIACTQTHTVVSGDTCYGIYTQYGVAPATFYALNPSLNNGNNCGNIQPGQILCVAGTVGPCSSTTTTTSATATPTACVACTQTHTVVSGDTCYEIYTQYGVAPATFYALNPSLNNGNNCGALQPGQILCVAGTTGPCSTTSTTSTTSSTTSSTSSSRTSSSTTTTTTSSTSSSSSTKTSSTTSTTSTSRSSTSSSTTSSSSSFSTTSSSSSSSTTSSKTTSTTSSTTSATSSTTSSNTTPTTSTTSSSSASSTTSSKTTPTTSSTTGSTTSTTSSTSSSSTGSSSITSMTSSTSSSTTSSSLPTSSNDCQPDNCLREFQQKTAVTAFCHTYTTSVNTATTGLPTFIANCQNNPSRISSACTCIVPPTSSLSSSASITSSTSSTTSISSSSSSITSSSSASSTSSASPTTSTSSSIPSSPSKSYTSFGNSTTSTMPTTSPVTYTTTTTSVYTVTSCPPTVTNCPLGHVTTDIITITTTYCPASATSTPTATSSPMQYTTSVVYTTVTYTITACPATVTNCPALIGSVTTETKVLYTTICPVAALTTPVTVPTSTAPGSPAKEVSNAVVSISPTSTLNFSPITYSTVPKSSSSSSSFVVVYQTMSVVPVASTSPSKAVVASASTVKPGAATFTGGAASTASLGVGGLMALVLCMVGWALM